ncbi:hypothetical protein CPG37_00430 [Malaciobacter canalis]|uniref:Uncharacterized protein n=1 Tax=Malaciobacter canalis TaxID=1912871 RepID=A0ABX4LSS1_9BACT|nr:hypothetical protein [Malaciobacter canalis]PHO10947.1 hypothetical protein CPG37_00430 [Malaciobacter canalis]QEE33022.1 hypothetical protein ACAN_1546 [Malaciobacter canalis]
MKEKIYNQVFFISIETLTKKKEYPYEKIYFLPLRENKTYLKDIKKLLKKKLISKTMNLSSKNNLRFENSSKKDLIINK